MQKNGERGDTYNTQYCSTRRAGIAFFIKNDWEQQTGCKEKPDWRQCQWGIVIGEVLYHHHIDAPKHHDKQQYGKYIIVGFRGCQKNTATIKLLLKKIDVLYCIINPLVKKKQPLSILVERQGLEVEKIDMGALTKAGLINTSRYEA